MTTTKMTVVVLFSFFVINAKSQGLTAMGAYEIATQPRDIADSLWNVEKPSGDNLLKSLVILQKGLEYLDRQDVWDLTEGNRYLKYRRFNILNDIAHVNSYLRNKDKTIQALQAMYNMGGYSYDFIAKDTAFDFIRQEKDYLELTSRLDQRESLWEAKSFKTPYREDIPLNEKIGGLSLLWSQAKYNFTHFDHAGVEWDKLYLDYINQVTQTKSTEEYYRVLIRFYASLKDGHTNVYFPNALTDKVYTRPPFRTELVEGRVFVSDIFADTLKTMGVEKGIEILAIDGEPVLDYAKKYVEPYQSSSTPQDMEVRKFTYGLLAGSKEKSIELKTRNQQGKERTLIIPRKGYSNTTSVPAIVYSEKDNIGYLELNSFGDNAVSKIYDSLFSSISKTKALIIDLRKNGGGSGNIGFHILSTLVDTPFAISSSRVTQYNSISNGGAQWNSFYPEKWYPSKKMLYTKPVIVLISARTFSAAEDFVVAFSYMKRGKMIGQTTGGSTGQPMFFDLPGGGTARVCAKDDFFPDGRIFVGKGIAPDIFINKTVNDVNNNTDGVLIKARELLK